VRHAHNPLHEDHAYVCFDERIEKIRSRYDELIAGIRQEAGDAQRDVIQLRERTHHDLVEKIDENARKLDDALGKLDTGLAEMARHHESRGRPE
tara:strand:+ start:943 stop:1224 length:282 start_codon:yes stop_codon:yes gene_type:complete